MPAESNKKVDDEFVPRETKNNNCNDKFMGGTKSIRYDYIAKTTTGDDDYPEEACDLFYHGNAQIDNLQVNTEINGTGRIDVDGTGDFGGNVTAPIFYGTFIGPLTGNVVGNLTGTASGNKSSGAFDISQPLNENLRVRHICAEGPEPGIYIRGRLTGKNVIDLPDYWDGLVDPETITVTLTQIGTSQDLIIDRIEYGKKVYVKSGNATAIDCFYEVWVARWLDPKDTTKKLFVTYEGKSPHDYPGDNSDFIVGGTSAIDWR